MGFSRGVVGDFQKGDIEASKGLREFFDCQNVFIEGSGDSFDEPFEFGVSVGNGVGEKHFLLRLREVVLELQLVTLLIATVSANSLHELYIVA